MRIKVQLSEQDFVDFNVFHVQNDESVIKGLKKQRMTSSLIIAAIGGLAAFMTKNENRIYMILITLGLVAFTYLNFNKSIVRSIEKRTKREIKAGRFTTALSAVDTTIDDEGISQHEDEQRATVKWEAIHKVYLCDDRIYLYASNAALAIPFSTLSNDEVAELKGYIEQNVNVDLIIDKQGV
ncbi:MAG: YcxB family protein [Erysipelothrix sp.]|nr:YcxB family protein [Erysipelothrix sp.]